MGEGDRVHHGHEAWSSGPNSPGLGPGWTDAPVEADRDHVLARDRNRLRASAGVYDAAERDQHHGLLRTMELALNAHQNPASGELIE